MVHNSLSDSDTHSGSDTNSDSDSDGGVISNVDKLKALERKSKDKENDINNQPWALIYLSPEKTGDEGEHLSVPAMHIIDFNYKDFQSNRQSYLTMPMKYRPSPRTISSECAVIYAKDSRKELEDLLKSMKDNKKRYPKPKLSSHLSFRSLIQSEGEGEQNAINKRPVTARLRATPKTQANKTKTKTKLIGKAESAAKQKRKLEEAAKKDQTKKTNSVIAETYVEETHKRKRLEMGIESTSAALTTNKTPTTVTTLTLKLKKLMDESVVDKAKIAELNETIQQLRAENPTTSGTSQENNEALIAAVRAYKIQIKDLKDRLEQSEKEKSKLRKTVEELQSEEDDRRFSPQEEKESLQEYDRQFNRAFIQSEEHGKEEGDKGEIKVLRLGVRCNSRAYADAFSQKKPSQFVSLLSNGIYKKDDLAARCRRKQIDTQNKEELDPTNTMVINEELYHFLRVKRFTLSQIETELSQVDRYHRNAITSAISSMKHAERNKKKADEAAQKALDELEEQSRSNPILKD